MVEDVAVDFDSFDNTVRITSGVCHIILHAAAAELVTLSAVEHAGWAQRGSVQVGTTNIGRAFWAADDTPGKVALLLGDDDETWDVAVTLDVSTVAELVRQARASLDPPV